MDLNDLIARYVNLSGIDTPVVGDDDRVVFVRTGKSKSTLYRTNPETGTTTALTELESASAPWDLLPVDDRVFLSTQDGNIDVVTDDDRRTILEGPGCLEPWDYHQDDGLYVLRHHERDWTLEYAVDNGTERIFDYPTPVPRRSAGVSPAGGTLALTVKDNPRFDAASHVRLLGDQDAQLEIASRQPVAQDWHQDSRHILIREKGSEPRVLIHDIVSETTDCIGDGKAVGFLDDDHILCWRSDGPAVLKTNGTDIELTLSDGSGFRRPSGNRQALPLFSHHVGDGWFLIEKETPSELSASYRYILQEQRTELVASPGDDSPQLVEPTDQLYPTAFGDDATIRLYVPPDLDGQTAAVVDIYGWTDSLTGGVDTRAQLLAAAGYIVARPTNSDSDFGMAPVENFRAAGEWIASRERVDSDRIAVMGFSRGGRDALLQATHNCDRWAAAVAAAPDADLRASYQQGEDHRGLREHLGDPAENTDNWDRVDPVQQAENLDCPTLLIHGTEDEKISLTRTRRFRDSVHEAGHGGRLRYVELSGLGHSLSRVECSWRVILAFLNEHLMSKSTRPA